MKKTLISSLIIALSLYSPLAGAKLSVGDPAPALKNGNWIQGDPVAAFDTNHVYIVEFWATWCGPCRASIPHLNQLWQQYKDKGVVAIGQDIWEEDDSGVSKFVKDMGTNMTYRVALDDKKTDPKGTMATTWMAAAGRDGIPTAFVVDKHGRIAWIGHPMDLQESVLDQILAGKFDTMAFAKTYEETRAKDVQRSALMQKVGNAVHARDWTAAQAALDEMDKAFPEEQDMIAGYRVMILLKQANYVEARKLAGAMSDKYPTNAFIQNQLAWIFATTKGLDQPGLQLAETMAERANNILNGKEPAVLDTLARTQFLNGKTNEAIATEQKAQALAPAKAQDLVKTTIDSYKAGKLPDVNEE